MANQRLTVSFRKISASLGQGTTSSLGIAVDAALMADGQPGTLNQVTVLNGALQLSFSGDLSDSWETGGSTTLERGSSSVVLRQTTPPDRLNSYQWPANTPGLSAWYGALPSTTLDFDIVLDDGASATTVAAEAGGPYTAAPGATVRLDGAAAVLNGSGATAYAWQIVSGGGSLQDPATARPTYTPPVLAAGAADRAVVLRLTATNNGVSDSDDAALTATAPPAVVVQPSVVSGPVRNLAAAVEDREANPTWDLPASGDAPTAILVDFRVGSGPWGITQELVGDATTTRIAPLDNGVTITIRVRARNDGGTSAEARVTVTPSAAAPLPPPAPVGVVQASRMDAGPVVDLFEVRLQGGAVERYATGPRAGESIVYGGLEYRPLPIALERAGFGGPGAAARPTLRVSRLDRAAAPEGWQGATVRRVRTLARYLDGASEADPSRHWPAESWVVDRQADRGRDEVVWQLSSPLDLELARIPRRQVLRDVCPWPYRRRVGGAWQNPAEDDGCPYRGTGTWNAQDEPVADPAEDVCSRRLSGCRLRFGEDAPLPFGGFAGVRR